MKIPTVHLNGTGKEELTENYQRAYLALYNAMEAMKRAAPNARDYYVQDSNAFTVAMLEHTDRLKMIQQVQDEIQEIYEQIVDA